MALGEVPYRLLKAIETCGSASQAATATGMAYRTAWVVLSRFEKTIGLTLVRRKAGGILGRGLQTHRHRPHVHRSLRKVSHGGLGGVRSAVQETFRLKAACLSDKDAASIRNGTENDVPSYSALSPLALQSW